MSQLTAPLNSMVQVHVNKPKAGPIRPYSSWSISFTGIVSYRIIIMDSIMHLSASLLHYFYNFHYITTLFF